MLYFNSCPRCKTGTVQLGSDFFGSFLSCLNCGFEKSANSVRKLNYEEIMRESDEAAALVTADAREHSLAGMDDSSEELDDFDDDLDSDDEEPAELERAVG